MRILRNRILTDPHAIRRVDIYRGSVRPINLVASVPFVLPDDVTYPFPAIRSDPGLFQVLFAPTNDLVPGDAYFDVWRMVGDDPGTSDLDDESLWISQIGMFWLFDDFWVSEDNLLTKRIGFEPLDKTLRRGEIRTLEIAIHPLPKYDYDFNKLAPIIPVLQPTITVRTSYNEIISGLDDIPCSIGVRQGHHRNSPFVVQCSIDTKILVRGTYQYNVKVNIGGEVIISPEFSFTIQ